LSNARRFTDWIGVRKKLTEPSAFGRLYEYWKRATTGAAVVPDAVLFEMSSAVRKRAVPTTRVTTGTSTE
jgi:hypothetical protein